MFVINFGYVIMMFSHHTILIPYLPTLPTVRRVIISNKQKISCCGAEREISRGGQFCVGRGGHWAVAWIRWVGWDD